MDSAFTFNYYYTQNTFSEFLQIVDFHAYVLYHETVNEDDIVVKTLQNETLSDDDIGRAVWYVPNHAPDDRSQWERGKIKSFDNQRQAAWVVYDHGNPSKVDHFTEYTAARTDYSSLTRDRVGRDE